MLEVDFLLKLLVALVLSGFIGLERELKERPAGLRTHILVCLGAAVFTILAVDFFSLYPDSIARIIAGIITGIGFLGAGTIMNAEHNIRGLTTAAGIWVVAGVGIAVGLGYYYMSLVLTVIVLLVLKLHSVERTLHTKKF
ncbi:MAG: MgtC/SapB family protein [Nanoarchaeota archaeon]|nr:MgtC/SapB family protein [Nanoarchaeota archaeon]MBU1030686.1 MgtC/SapB family protein [Nanoarchaeota archaeon]MBU1849345.1 MgtC/SapB family protein [Nanoarchaeota archaeon]